MSVITVVIGGTVGGSVLLIALVLFIILAWNYIKLLFEAAERYILLGCWSLPHRWPLLWAVLKAPPTSSKAGAGCWEDRSFCW